MAITYKDAASTSTRVRPRRADQALARLATRPEVLAASAGSRAVRPARQVQEPLLVSGTTGGTKLKSAFATGRHDTVGIDWCDERQRRGGDRREPLFFLDYFATGKLDVGVAEQVIAGIAEAAGSRAARCSAARRRSCRFYQPASTTSRFAVAWSSAATCATARTSRGRRARRARVVGAALERPLAGAQGAARAAQPGLGRAAAAARRRVGGGRAPAPTRIYVAALAALADAKIRWKGAAHIRAGPHRHPRASCPRRSVRAALPAEQLAGAPVFHLIAQAGVAPQEMRRTFNMGLGLVLAVPPADAARAVETLIAAGERAYVVGEVIARAGTRSSSSHEPRRRAGVGQRHELRRCWTPSARARSPGVIACVVSNRPGVQALDRATTAGKPGLVVDTSVPGRDRSRTRSTPPGRHRVEVIVLAGFMRLLTARSSTAIRTRDHIHPSLCRRFRRRRPTAGVRARREVTGCTVHFVNARSTTAPSSAGRGAVADDDDVERLRQRILAEEHRCCRARCSSCARGGWRGRRRVTLRP